MRAQPLSENYGRVLFGPLFTWAVGVPPTWRNVIGHSDISAVEFPSPKLVVGLNLDSEVGSDLFGPALVLNVPVPVLWVAGSPIPPISPRKLWVSIFTWSNFCAVKMICERAHLDKSRMRTRTRRVFLSVGSMCLKTFWERNVWFLFSGDSPLRQTELGGYGAGIIQVVAQWPSGHGHILGTWSVPVSHVPCVPRSEEVSSGPVRRSDARKSLAAHFYLNVAVLCFTFGAIFVSEYIYIDTYVVMIQK